MESVVINIDDFEDDNHLPSQKVTDEGRGTFLKKMEKKETAPEGGAI